MTEPSVGSVALFYLRVDSGNAYVLLLRVTPLALTMIPSCLAYINLRMSKFLALVLLSFWLSQSIDSTAQTSVTRGPRQLTVSTAYNHLSTGAFRVALLRDLRPARTNARGGGRYWQGGFGLEAYGFKGEPRDRYDFALTYQAGLYGRTAWGATLGAALFGGAGVAHERVLELGPGFSFTEKSVYAPSALVGLRPQIGFAGRRAGRVPWDIYVGARVALDFFFSEAIPYSGHAHIGPEVGVSIGLGRMR